MVTDVDVTTVRVQLQLELPLRHGALDLLAVGGVAGGVGAHQPALHQAAGAGLAAAGSAGITHAHCTPLGHWGSGILYIQK